MSNITSPEAPPQISRRNLVRGALATGALTAVGDIRPTHALPEQAPEVAIDPPLSELASSKHFNLGGLSTNHMSLPSFFPDRFTHVLTDGAINPDEMTTSPDPDGYDFEKLDSYLKQAERSGKKSVIHHALRGYHGIDGKRIGPWMEEEIARNGGNPIPVIDRHLNTVIDHIAQNHDLSNIQTITGANETINWYGGFEDIVDQSGNVIWGNLWNRASANHYGDARRYLVDTYTIIDQALQRVSGTNINVITNDWGAELAYTPKGDTFAAQATYLHEMGAPFKGQGYQIHLWPGDPNHAYPLSDGYQLTLANDEEIDIFTRLFAENVARLPEGIVPYGTEFSIDDTGWKNMGYTEEQIKYFKGRILSNVIKVIADGGGNSLMLFDPYLLAKAEPNDPIHSVVQAISDLPSK